MPAIVVNYSEINLEKVFPAPKKVSGMSVGLVLLISADTLTQLKKIPVGKKRVEYFNSSTFISKVQKHYFIYFDAKNNTINLSPIIYENFSDILSALFSGFSKDKIIIVSIPLSTDKFKILLSQFSKHDFSHPYITDKNLFLSRVNTPVSKIEQKSILLQVKDVLEQSRRATCSINAQLTSRAIGFLKKASKIGITVNGDGKKSQKELSGELHVEKIVKRGDKIVYLIDIDEKNVGSGSEEEVNVSPTRYNFHSHPQEAYVRHSVDKAWPSLTDYLGYLKLGNNTIFHCVATLEGVYIMSFGSYWVKNLENVSTSFVEKNYDIDHKEKYTPEQYADKMNSQKYKGYPIFNVQYISWNNIHKVFSVNYAKTNDTCIAVEQDMRRYSKLKK